MFAAANTLLAREPPATASISTTTSAGSLRELSRSARYNRPLALCMLDIDHFKSVNDQLGHLGGDFTLSELASCIRKAAAKILGAPHGHRPALAMSSPALPTCC